MLTLPSTFRWGPRLRTLHSSRIAFPSFPQLLSPSQDLVDLQLDEIHSDRYFPPQKRSRMHCPGLPNFDHFHSIFFPFPPAETTLACLHRQGNVLFSPLSPASNIEELASAWTISWPKLTHFVSRISILRSLEPTMDAPQLGRFIDRIEMLSSHRRADVLTSERAISTSFTQPNVPLNCEYHVGS